MSNSSSSKFGNSRRATILKYNGDGTVTIALDEIGLYQTDQRFKAVLPLAWSGPSGEFIGGEPIPGSSVRVSQSQGGQWFVDSYIPSRGVFADDNLMSNLKLGRALIQVKGGNYLFVDPTIGIQTGNNDQLFHLDPQREILSSKIGTELKFTEGSRLVNGLIKRDLKENSFKGNLGSTLNSHVYQDSLSIIAMDPSSPFAIKTVGNTIRNPPLVEKRELNYEFAYSYLVGNDVDESVNISNSFVINSDFEKNNSSANTLSLNLNHPNHLMEVIKGTVVDSFGNILDLNRSILPVGRIETLSLNQNENKAEAFIRIKNSLRKSIAFHWEINTRKSLDKANSTSIILPDVEDVTDYSRKRSTFFLDIDKEGQIKLNVPQSSETGNIPLHTRHENYSNLLNKKDPSISYNSFARNKDNQDIFLDSFAHNAKIKLISGTSSLDGYASPVDRITAKPIMFGTVYHDITQACFGSLSTAAKINLFEPNTITSIPSYSKIVEDTLIISGPQANAGGRSGSFNFEGFANFNFGANTSDRQSLWLDCAGGIVSQIGRDKRGISHAAHLDGDLIIQIGGVGINSNADSRFSDQSDGPRFGALDIRVMDGNRPATILRIDKYGIRIATEGRLELTGQQGIMLSTTGSLTLNGERVCFYTNTSGRQRVVERNGIPI